MPIADGARRLAEGGVALARQRLELAALDLEEELLRATGTVASLLAIAVLALLGLAALAGAVVVACWDTARIAALLGVASFFGLGAGALGWRLRRAAASRPAFFAATLEALRRDADMVALVRGR